MRKLNTADIFGLFRVIKETNLKDTLAKEFTALAEGKKGIKSAEFGTQEGMDIIFAIISAFGSKGAENAFFEFLSGPFEMSADEIRALPPTETLAKIGEVASIEEWKNFFTYASSLTKK